MLIRGTEQGDIRIVGEEIAEMGTELEPDGDEPLIGAGGLTAYPGFIDAHVHFNEPGRADWEGFATGSRAFAAGGGTVFFDMPLNSSPVTTTPEAFEKKRTLGVARSVTDFCLWGGLVPDTAHVDKLFPLARAGAVGFKAFMADSGLPEFPRVTNADLRRGMAASARFDLPVAVHAESHQVLSAQPAFTDGTPAAFLRSRPIEAEVEAVRVACDIAGETGCALHVVHVSCPEALAEISAARQHGADVTAETCPHYLVFDEAHLHRLGALAKCAPPLRSGETVERLWQDISEGAVHTIGSDHSPAPAPMKTGCSFAKAWGGIAGCQHAFAAFLGISPLARADNVRLLASNAAERFRLPRRGTLEVGAVADVALVEFGDFPAPATAELLYQHQLSPYTTIAPRARIRATINRGRLVYRHRNSPPPAGPARFLRPAIEL